MQQWLSSLAIVLRGMCMGVADVIPGVSGGTIAFITGITPRLLAALAAFSQPPLWQALRTLDLRRVWTLADANFLLLLFGGILCAIALFSSVLHHWLEHGAHLLLGFFFGLVLASVVAVGRRVPKPLPWHGGLALAAAALTFYLVQLDATTLPADNYAALFGGGMVAICAMLLPGISGSYLLLIFGLYPAVISAVHERDLLTLCIFAAGCGSGLLLFARLLTALLRRCYTATMMVLLGVMVGALPKLWPWKQGGEGVRVILQPNVLPAQAGGDAQVALVLTLALAGAAAVLLIDHLARRQGA